MSVCKVLAEFVHFSDEFLKAVRGDSEDNLKTVKHTQFVFFILQKHKVLLIW